MTNTFKAYAKFHDGTNYSIKMAVDTFTKGSHRLLVAIFNEALAVMGENPQPDNLTNLFSPLSGKSLNTATQLLRLLTDGSVQWREKVSFRPAKKGGRVISSEAAIAFQSVIDAGNGIDACLTLLSDDTKNEKPFDLEKRVKTLVKAAIKAGKTEKDVLSAVSAAFAAEAKAESEKSKPIMDMSAVMNQKNVAQIGEKAGEAA